MTGQDMLQTEAELARTSAELRQALNDLAVAREIEQCRTELLAQQNGVILAQGRLIGLLCGQVGIHQRTVDSLYSGLQTACQVNHDLAGSLEDAHLRVSDAQRQTTT